MPGRETRDAAMWPVMLGREAGDRRDVVGDAGVRWEVVYVDPERRFSLDLDPDSGRTFVSVSVDGRNAAVSYDEWYEVDPREFERYHADPRLADQFVEQCRRGELDHRRFVPPS